MRLMFLDSAQLGRLRPGDAGSALCLDAARYLDLRTAGRPTRVGAIPEVGHDVARA